MGAASSSWWSKAAGWWSWSRSSWSLPWRHHDRVGGTGVVVPEDGVGRRIEVAPGGEAAKATTMSRVERRMGNRRLTGRESTPLQRLRGAAAVADRHRRVPRRARRGHRRRQPFGGAGCEVGSRSVGAGCGVDPAVRVRAASGGGARPAAHPVLAPAPSPAAGETTPADRSAVAARSLISRPTSNCRPGRVRAMSRSWT